MVLPHPSKLMSAVRFRYPAPIYRKFSSAVEQDPYTVKVKGSIPLTSTSLIRSVAQSGSAPGLGPGGPRFESLYSDHFLNKET